MGSKSKQCLTSDEHGQPEPVAPKQIHFQRVLQTDVLVRPAVEGNPDGGHGQQQQRNGVKQDSECGPAFHVTTEFSQQVQHQASEISA